MITIDRDPDVVKWAFPFDTVEPKTIFTIKKSNPAETVFRTLQNISNAGQYDFNDWCAEKFGRVTAIENWPGKNGPETITEPSDIIKACQSLKEDEIIVLVNAIDRRGESYRLGIVEKN